MHNQYRCEHSFDRENCQFCNPSATNGPIEIEWYMDEDNPLMGELESQEERLARKQREKQAREDAKLKAKEEKMKLTKMHFEDGEEYDPNEAPPINDLPF